MAEPSKCKNHLLNLYNGTPAGKLTGHSTTVTKICAFTVEDSRIFSVSEDNTIIVYSLYEDGKEVKGIKLHVVTAHTASISDCSINRMYGFLCTSSLDKTVKVWDLNTMETRNTFVGHTDEVLSVTFDEEHTRVISGSKDLSVRLWDILSDEVWENSNAHTAPITCLNRLTDQPSSQFISASENGKIFEWDLYSFTSNKKYAGHQGCINSVSVSPDSTKMVVGGAHEKLTIWDIGTYQQNQRFTVSGIVRAVCISPQYYIFAIGEEEKILMYNFNFIPPYQTIIPDDIDTKNPPKVTALCWSDDSKYLYAGYSDGKIRIFKFSKVYIKWHHKKFAYIRNHLYAECE